MSEIRGTIMSSAGPLLGVAIAIVIITLIAGMSIVGVANSANLICAVRYIGMFIPLVGLVSAVAIALAALKRI